MDREQAHSHVRVYLIISMLTAVDWSVHSYTPRPYRLVQPDPTMTTAFINLIKGARPIHSWQGAIFAIIKPPPPLENATAVVLFVGALLPSTTHQLSTTTGEGLVAASWLDDAVVFLRRFLSMTQPGDREANWVWQQIKIKLKLFTSQHSTQHWKVTIRTPPGHWFHIPACDLFQSIHCK